MVDSNNAINNTVGASISGVTNTLTVTNASDTASSAARGRITVGGSSSADPSLNFNVAAANDFEIGIDNSEDDSFKIAASTTLGTTDTFIMTTGGQRTLPLQSFFFAYLTADQNNVTGDGTDYAVQFPVTEKNINSDFDTSTGVYTAPVDGTYFFECSIITGGYLAAHTTGKMTFTRNSSQYGASSRGNYVEMADAGNNLSVSTSTNAFLTAGDTFAVRLDVIGGTKVINILEQGGFISTFSGGLAF